MEVLTFIIFDDLFFKIVTIYEMIFKNDLSRIERLN